MAAIKLADATHEQVNLLVNDPPTLNDRSDKSRSPDFASFKLKAKYTCLWNKMEPAGNIRPGRQKHGDKGEADELAKCSSRYCATKFRNFRFFSQNRSTEGPFAPLGDRSKGLHQ